MSSYMFLPEVGSVTKEEFLAFKAAKDYDERLLFMRNPKNGEYAVFVKTDRSDGQPPLRPVLGFGREVPSPDAIRERLWNADTWRHGKSILDEMDRKKKQHDAENEWVRSNAAEESAERIEHVLRQNGMSPVIKSLPKS